MKNQKSILLAASFMFIGLLACNSEQTTEQTTAVENTASAAAPVENELDMPPLSSIPESSSLPTATIPPPTALNTAGSFANTGAPINTNAPLNSSVAVNNTSPKGSVRLNPAHGQPGHDCAIAVGAPLKGSVASTPAAAPAKVIATKSIPLETKAVVATAAAPAAVPSFFTDPTAKLNPAHGQPGHDCAVAVGAPLPVK
jgi:hypothetical protein